jgi:hypothetical protein
MCGPEEEVMVARTGGGVVVFCDILDAALL